MKTNRKVLTINGEMKLHPETKTLNGHRVTYRVMQHECVGLGRYLSKGKLFGYVAKRGSLWVILTEKGAELGTYKTLSQGLWNAAH